MASRARHRPSEAGSGAGFDVLPVYKDLGQLQKVNSGGGFVAETVQKKGTLSRCCEHFEVRAGSLDLGES